MWNDIWPWCFHLVMDLPQIQLKSANIAHFVISFLQRPKLWMYFFLVHMLFLLLSITSRSFGWDFAKIGSRTMCTVLGGFFRLLKKKCVSYVIIHHSKIYKTKLTLSECWRWMVSSNISSSVLQMLVRIKLVNCFDIVMTCYWAILFVILSDRHILILEY